MMPAVLQQMQLLAKIQTLSIYLSAREGAELGRGRW